MTNGIKAPPDRIVLSETNQENQPNEGIKPVKENKLCYHV